MLSKTRSTPGRSPAPGVIPDTIKGPVALPSKDPKAATQPAATAPGRPASALDSAASERDERRHQRAVAREGNGRGPGTGTGERLQQGKTQPTGPSRRGQLALRETVSAGLIGIVVVGLIVGGILGALGAPGWVVGLLVTTLTLILSAVIRRSPRLR
jgi:hypothetical protein